ncbi:RNA methyltransferase [Candidatus Woesearchaeota archaeon]|nr:RNA methyltransferase [Candidatus Woesearchaeota archaeon]
MPIHETAIVTVPGFEDIAALEVKELVGAKATIAAGGRVAFQTKNLNDLCKLCYLSQSANSVFLLPQKAPINLFEMGKREYEVFGSNGGISGSLSYLMLRVSGYTGRESLFDPFTGTGTIAIEAALFSSGFPVNHYRKDSLAAAFSKLPQFSKADFSEFFAATEREAAAAAKKRVKSSKPKILSSSPSMQNVRFAEKNAKVAGVNKLVRFSRLDIEWLDAKLAENSIDLVVSYPPQFRSGSGVFAAAENKKLTKLYKDFFYQADFFLKKDGSMVFLLRDGFVGIASAAANHKFRPGILRKFQIGGELFELVSFTNL